MSAKSPLNTFLEYFATHPTAANLLMLIFIFLGVTSLADIRRETFPDFTASEVEVTVLYPGATAEDVEEAICQRIEDALDGVTYVEEIRSEAKENQGSVVVEMEDAGNMTTFLNDVKTEVEAIDDFPDEAEAPIIKQLGRTDLVASVAVSGAMSTSDLKIYCEQLKARMLQTPGISQVEILGFSEHQIRIELPSFALLQYGLSVRDVADTIERQSVDLPSGAIETKDADIMIRFADERRTIQQYQDLIVISSSTGAELRLGDIAAITDRFEYDESKSYFDGERSALLQVSKTKSEDALKIMDSINSFIERERQANPPTVHFTITQNVSDIVRDRLNMLTVNGEQGFVLVFLVMWLFFSFRFSFWVSMGLPVSFLGALYFLPIIGFSLNMLTMVGLLLAIGLLMDDAIVIAENVAAHLERGQTALRAAVDGTAEVAGGVLSSFLTTMFIFGSIAVFISGNIGKVLWVMPVVLLLTLSVSLVEAFLILPNHLAHSLKGKEGKKPGRFRQLFERVIEFSREKICGTLVDVAISWRYLFVGLVIAVFLSSIGMLASERLKVQAFPDIDGDVLQARLLMPQGTPLHRCEAVVKKITDALMRTNEAFKPEQPMQDGEHMDLVQHYSVQYNVNQDAGESGPHVATISVDLLKAEVRNARLDAVSEQWRKEVGDIPDVISLTYKQPSMGPAGLAIDIRLQGQDLVQLKAASVDVQNWLNKYDGVVDLTDDLRPGKPEILVKLKQGATALGMSASAIAQQLRAAYFGTTVTEIQHNGESYEVDVRLDSKDQDSLADLGYFHIVSSNGDQIPLSSIADLSFGRGYATISRIDSVRTVNITGDVDTRFGNANAIINDTKARFLPQLQEKYPGIKFMLEGEAKEGAETQASLRKALMVGLFGVFVLLSFQFKSYLEPFVVITAIPMALIGVIWGHLIMGHTLSMPSIMGFVSLAGVVVNDSILLVQFIKKHIDEGMSVPDAARRASRRRFRAILLTSLTTIAGLLPLMFERSLQAQILIPLAVSIVFGLLASTVLILALVPSLYTILDDMGLASHSKSRDKHA